MIVWDNMNSSRTILLEMTHRCYVSLCNRCYTVIPATFCKKNLLHYVITILKFVKLSLFVTLCNNFFQKDPKRVYEVFLSNFVIETFLQRIYTAQKMNFSIMDFFSKCDQICSLLRIWSDLLQKSLMKK